MRTIIFRKRKRAMRMEGHLASDRSELTLEHCRDGFSPFNFIRSARDDWEGAGAKSLLERVKDAYLTMKNPENRYAAKEGLVKELDDLVKAADRAIN